MDDKGGIFPAQANGPIDNYYGQFLAVPLATGKKLVVAPEQESQRIMIETKRAIGTFGWRSNHNNGWYIVRSMVPANATRAQLNG